MPLLEELLDQFLDVFRREVHSSRRHFGRRDCDHGGNLSDQHFVLNYIRSLFREINEFSHSFGIFEEIIIIFVDFLFEDPPILSDHFDIGKTVSIQLLTGQLVHGVDDYLLLIKGLDEILIDIFLQFLEVIAFGECFFPFFLEHSLAYAEEQFTVYRGWLLWVCPFVPRGDRSISLCLLLRGMVQLLQYLLPPLDECLHLWVIRVLVYLYIRQSVCVVCSIQVVFAYLTSHTAVPLSKQIPIRLQAVQFLLSPHLEYLHPFIFLTMKWLEPLFSQFPNQVP